MVTKAVMKGVMNTRCKPGASKTDCIRLSLRFHESRFYVFSRTPPRKNGPCRATSLQVFVILRDMWTDELSKQYADLLDGSYNCVDRIVLNAYCTLCYSAGGFRTWWRRLYKGSDDELDDNHLMRMAGRFSRRVHGYASANGIPVIQCNTEQRKHLIAEEYLQKNSAVKGLFLILVSRAVATVWTVKRSRWLGPWDQRSGEPAHVAAGRCRED